jgi:hypothetical protein
MQTFLLLCVSWAGASAQLQERSTSHVALQGINWQGMEASGAHQ